MAAMPAVVVMSAASDLRSAASGPIVETVAPAMGPTRATRASSPPASAVRVPSAVRRKGRAAVRRTVRRAVRVAVKSVATTVAARVPTSAKTIARTTAGRRA